MDNQLDLEKRYNLKELNLDGLSKNQNTIQSSILKVNSNQLNSNQSMKDADESLIREIKAQSEFSNPNKLSRVTNFQKEEYSGQSSNFINDKCSKGSSLLILNQTKSQHHSQQRVIIQNDHSRNNLDPLNLQILSLYQVDPKSSIKSTDNKNIQEQQNPKKNIVSYDNKNIIKNNIQSTSGKQIVQQKQLVNNDQSYQKHYQSMYNQVSNKSINIDSLSTTQNQQKKINIKEIPLQLQSNQDLQASSLLSLTQSQILQTEVATKLLTCYYCGNVVDSSGSIQLNCFHNHHVSCLEEQIGYKIKEGKTQINCQCNVKIPQKQILKLFQQNSQIRDLFFTNQLQCLIKLFQQKNQDKKVCYDPNPQIQVNKKKNQTK